jgi:hypothetical protein
MTVGYFRIVSFRSRGDAAPESDETIIDMDRSHPCLGNRHYLKNKNDKLARSRVIAANADDLARDLAIKGPMYFALYEIATRIADGEKICGRCWCHPLPCHLDNYAPVIDRMVKSILHDRALHS